MILPCCIVVCYRDRMRTLSLILIVFLIAGPVAAQTPTPEPTPTPQVVHGAEGDFVVTPEISYGEGGVIVGLLLVAGLLLVQIIIEVGSWLRE